jgi:glycerol kinase
MKRQMYATVRRYEGVPDPEIAAKQVEEKFVPFISALPGFVEYYWIDLRDGAMISITVFKTLPDAMHANNEARAFVKAHLSSVLPRAPRVDAGTIVAYKGTLKNESGK